MKRRHFIPSLFFFSFFARTATNQTDFSCVFFSTTSWALASSALAVVVAVAVYSLFEKTRQQNSDSGTNNNKYFAHTHLAPCRSSSSSIFCLSFLFRVKLPISPCNHQSSNIWTECEKHFYVEKASCIAKPAKRESWTLTRVVVVVVVAVVLSSLWPLVFFFSPFSTLVEQDI